jgi:hypothetical protein
MYYLIIYNIVPPIGMTLPCILTLKNIREQTRRIQPTTSTGNDSMRRIEQQIIRMLFSQVLLQLICILPNSILNLIDLFTGTTTTLYIYSSVKCLLH